MDPVESERRRKMARAFEMREEGKSYDLIATELGIGSTTVHRWIWQHIDPADEEPSPDSQKLRAKELAKLEKVFIRLWRAIDGDDDEVAIKAASAFFKGSERRAKLLGLDAPTRVDVKDVSDAKKKLAEMTAEQRIALHEKAIAEERAKLQGDMH